MLLNSLCALAFTAATSVAVASETTPFFLLASTAELPAADDSVKVTNVRDVYDVLWPSLGNCPTKHYAVIVEPLTLIHPHISSPLLPAFIPEGKNQKSVFAAESFEGKVNLDALMNTILMDCLDHGILRAEELDTSDEAIAGGLPELDDDTLRHSFIYARMPEVDTQLRTQGYITLMKKRQQFVEDIMKKYFSDEDYTLIILREEVAIAKGIDVNLDEEAEVPFIGDS